MTEHLYYDEHTHSIRDENGLTVARGVNPQDGPLLAAAPRLLDLGQGMESELGMAGGESAAEFNDLTKDLERETRVPATETTLWLVLDHMLAHEAKAFETDEPVNAADLLDAFVEWRAELRDALNRLRPPIIRQLLADAANLLDEAVTSHIYDEQNGDEIPDDCPYVLTARECGAAAAGEIPTQRIGITVQGGVVQSVWSDRPVVGVDVTVFDFDADDDDDGVSIVNGEGGFDQRCAVTTGKEIEQAAWPTIREITDED